MGRVAPAETEHPDLQPEDERTALVQRLDQYRAIATAALRDLEWEDASTRLLPTTDLTWRTRSIGSVTSFVVPSS